MRTWVNLAHASFTVQSGPCIGTRVSRVQPRAGVGVGTVLGGPCSAPTVSSMATRTSQDSVGPELQASYRNADIPTRSGPSSGQPGGGAGGGSSVPRASPCGPDLSVLADL